MIIGKGRVLCIIKSKLLFGRKINLHRPFGNLGIGISALALASASAFQYKYGFLHSINSLHVISKKVATYRLEACDFVRKSFAKISRRKFSDNLKKVTFKNPYEKTSVLESLFNEIAGINSRLAPLVKKKPPPKAFTCEYIRTFSASTGRSYMSSVFFHKTEGCLLQGCNFIKKLVHHRLFSQNIVF